MTSASGIPLCNGGPVVTSIVPDGVDNVVTGRSGGMLLVVLKLVILHVFSWALACVQKRVKKTLNFD